MKKTTSFRFGFIGFAIVFLVSLLLSGILGISGFEKTYKDSLVSQYSIQGENLKGRIESALNLGKRLHLLGNQIDDFFFDSMRLSSGINHFYVADKDNSILYSTRSVLNQRTIPFSFSHGENLKPGELRPASDTVTFLDSYYICIPLYSDEVFYEGTLLLEFSQESVSSFILKIAEKSLGFAAILLVITLLLYIVLFLLFGRYPKGETIITIVLLLASQLLFTAQNFTMYNNSISDVFGKNMSVQAKSLAEDFQKLLDYSVKIEDMGGADAYLAKRTEGNPQCANAYITDINLNVLFDAASLDNKREDQKLTRQNADLTILPLSSGYGNGYIVLQINRQLINTILRDMALDSGTVILVALIFTFILKDLLRLLSTPALLRHTASELVEKDPQKALLLIKISTFLFMFAAFETLSFIPLFIQRIFQQSVFTIPGLSEQTIISLPVGSYMLGVMISMFVTLFVLKTFSIRAKYIIMTLFFVVGSFFTIQATSFEFLTAARLVAGFGFGGVLLSTSSLVIAYTNNKTISQGFGTNAAAFAAASICAIPIGGIIVNKFGYEAGIWVSIVFALLFLAFSIFCISDGRKKTTDIVEAEETLNVRSFFRILFSKHIIVYIICINIPFQLIYVGLFQFLLPLYMSDTLQLSQGNIGRILCIFSVVSLGAAWVSRLADHIRKDNVLIAIGAICVGIMLILFKLYPEGGLVLFMGVMIGMGLDNVFIDAIEEVYVASGKIRAITEENLLQSYKTIEKIISVFIPTLTGLVIFQLGFNSSMMVIGLWSLLGAVAFIFLGKNKRWETNKNEKM